MHSKRLGQGFLLASRRLQPIGGWRHHAMSRFSKLLVAQRPRECCPYQTSMLFHGRQLGGSVRGEHELVEGLRSLALTARSMGGICLGARGSTLGTRGGALSVRDIALSAGGNAGATVASSRGGLLSLAARSHAVRAKRTIVEGTVASRRGRGGSVVTLVGQSLVGTDGAALLHRGAVVLTVEVVSETRLTNILEVGRGYDELVMQFQCMKRWKMLTVLIPGAGVARVKCIVTVLHSSRGYGSLGGGRGVEVLARCVGIRGVDRVARFDTKVSETSSKLEGAPREARLPTQHPQPPLRVGLASPLVGVDRAGNTQAWKWESRLPPAFESGSRARSMVLTAFGGHPCRLMSRRRSSNESLMPGMAGGGQVGPGGLHPLLLPSSRAHEPARLG